jgi:putative membrane protein
MVLRWLVAFIHLVALVIGVAAILVRARALNRVRHAGDLAAVFLADNWWGIAALLWLVSGLWRAFGGLDKGTAYYLGNPLFHAKLGLFLVVFLLEMWPMVTLLRWRRAVRQFRDADLRRAPFLARISYVQLGLVGVMLLLATALARGIGV